jgi:xanthine dehydrogenase large subunit
VNVTGAPIPHESARGHVTGEALYVDDLCGRYPNLLHAWPVCAPHAHALVSELDASRALEEPGVMTVLTLADVQFDNGICSAGGTSIEFIALCETAYKQRVPLFAEGFYRTPDIHFNFKTSRGRPFHYYAYGAAVSEVEVDGFTGQFRLLRTDILHDAGDSISPIVDRGQIEGGFLQGVGWLTLEELLWDAQGRVSSAGASTYKLPSWSEVPEVFNVEMLERATQPGVVMGSKAVGEPPLMLAFSVREALRDAIAAFGEGQPFTFDSPATPERIFFAVRQVRRLALK